jgi:hypothetical protein
MPRNAERDRAIDRMAQRQRGLVTATQLRELGISRNGVRSRAANGGLVLVAPRVFKVGGVRWGWEQRALATCLANGPQAALSHLSAARMWQLDLGRRWRDTDIVEITVPVTHHPAALKSSRVHRTQYFTECAAASLGGFLVTSLARTFIDVAGAVHRGPLTKALDEKILRGDIHAAQFARMLCNPMYVRRAGNTALREITGLWLAGSTPMSVAEAAVLRTFESAGIDRPVCQYEVSDGAGGRYFLDFAWPAARLALEVDGFRYHATPTSYANDTRRANRLVALGWIVLRTTPREMLDTPTTVLEAVRARLGVALPEASSRRV